MNKNSDFEIETNLNQELCGSKDPRISEFEDRYSGTAGYSGTADE